MATVTPRKPLPSSTARRPGALTPATPKPSPQTRKNAPPVSQNKNLTPKAAARLARVREFIHANPTIFARQGSVAATWRTYKGKKLGPYYQLTYRQDGRQAWLYLGRCRQLAQEVAALLQNLHRPRDQRRLSRRLQTEARQNLRLAKSQLKQVCASIGIQVKGWEFRGAARALANDIPGPLLPPSPAIRQDWDP